MATSNSSKAKPTMKEITQAIEKTKSKAEEYARDPKKAKKLLDDAIKKAKNYERNRGPLADVWAYLTALFRLLRAYIRGEYRDIAWGSVVLVIAAIIYFVSPVDLIPDVLPGGFIDDAMVIGFIIAQIKADLDNFMAWEIAQSDNKRNDEDIKSEPV